MRRLRTRSGMHPMLLEHFKEIDRLVAAHAPDVASGLRAGAEDAGIERLLIACFADSAVPHDLAALFRWHDGQGGYNALSPLDKRMLPSVDDAIDAWLFPSDPLENVMPPWHRAWSPAPCNGAGDYLVYDASADGAGRIRAFWHDSADRSIEFNSIQNWASRVRDAYTAATPA